MVHFPGLARTRLCIQRAVIWFYQMGFPHSEIPGSRPVCGFPGLIAAYHVLLRLLAPRHPPYALSSLTIKLTQHVSILSDSKLRISAATVLQSVAPKSLRVLHAVLRRNPAPDSRTPHAWQVRLSTLRYSRAKLAVSRYAKLENRITRCLLPSVVKEPVPLINFRSERLRSRRSAVPIWSRPCVSKLFRTTKNPASSAGQVRPSRRPFRPASRTA
jgi:hypothetical protein